MKKLLICACALLVSATMVMGQKTKAKTTTKTAVTTKTPAKPVMKNLSDSFSYAAGMNIATNMKDQGITSINTELMAKAINDVFTNKEKALTPEVATSCLQNQMAIYGEKKNAEMAKQNEAMAKQNHDIALIEMAKGKAFLDSNKLRKGVVELPDGLQFEVIKPGDSTGIRPTLTDTVVINYVGKLIDGTEFDGSIKNGVEDPITWHVNGFIKGWSEILQMMSKGSHFKVYIPSDLAYGERGSGGIIKPGATLIFDMMLVDIKPSVKQ